MNAPHWWPVYVGIGSNLDSPEKQVRQAIAALGDLPGSILVSESGLYRSSPLGPVEQPDFINAVVGLLTQTRALDFLHQLHELERAHGRERDGERWGPRTLDLDLLAYAGQIIEDEELVVPHPGIAERNFVLLPWREIAASYRVPGLAEVTVLAANVSATEPRIERIDK